jgi:flavin-dependent dehydrogenase
MEYDVVIVGARVAGASLALRLGRAGVRVLLVDRDRFPSDTLSTHLLTPAAVAFLEELGVREDVEAIGLRRITRLRTTIEDCAFEGPCMAPAPAYALAPRRDALDAILIRHAVEQPSVELRQATLVEGLLCEGERVVGVHLASGPVRARIVVGADGMDSRVARWTSAGSYNDIYARRPVYYGYYRGLAPFPEPTMELHLQGGMIGFVFPMEPGRDCIALELQSEDFPHFRRDALNQFEQRLRLLPGLGQRLAGARIEGRLKGTRGVPGFFRNAYGSGWALTGDAGCSKDPSTGLGIGDAFLQSRLLADAITAFFAGGDWASTMAGFQARRDEALLPWYLATAAFADAGPTPPEAMPMLRTVLSNPGLVRLLAKAMPQFPDMVPERYQPMLTLAASSFSSSTVAES